MLAQLGTFLNEVGITPQEILEYHPLQSGQSGASTYWLRLESRETVLKVAPASSSFIVRERARRELTFYRDLANALPLRVPHMWASYQGPKGVALLLEALIPTPQPKEWSEDTFLEAISQLAHVHTKFWDATASLISKRWLVRDVDQAAEVKSARSSWQKLHEITRFTQVLDACELAWLNRLLDAYNEVQALIEILPVTLCHGDCTTLNILLDSAGNLVWSDWQEIRLGRGPEDVAFLLERASVSGANVPYEKLLNAYCDQLEQPVTLTDIEYVVQAAELRSRMLYWPAYLTRATEVQLAAMLKRLHTLTHSLEISVA